ncbi:MAG: nucleotidyltransferase family protein [Verrucomicrobia bacterium]|nr:nucleotidyltransferase family protein [Verrucomicrobiota bacterium]
MHTRIREAMKVVDRSGRISIALLVDEQGCLLNTLTDGDIRRGLLTGIGLDACVSELLPIKATTPYPQALTAPLGTDRAALLKLMQDRSVRQIPLLDAEGKVADIVILRDLLPHVSQPMQAVIMAGGKGTRLRPLTENVPKPMLLVGGRPLMERIVEQLQQAGIRRVNVTTHYMPEKIVQHFGKGDGFGVDINYVNEDRAMGTAGALGLMPIPQETVLVINGDVLTDVGFQALLAYHQEHKAEMTVGVRQYALQVPYGVIECEGTSVRALREKPEVKFLVNAGVYLIEPSVYEFIPKGEKFDMTDLIQRLLDSGRSVISYPIVEYWLDVGQPADFERAQQDATNGTCKGRGLSE